MPQKKKSWVRFKSTTTIPADVVGKKEDQEAAKGEELQLPAGYANFLISSGLADECDAPKRSGKKKPEDLSAALVADAKALVASITGKMEAMSEGDDGWEELAGQLDEARTALAELQTPA